jgi:hypothetical protein
LAAPGSFANDFELPDNRLVFFVVGFELLQGNFFEEPTNRFGASRISFK